MWATFRRRTKVAVTHKASVSSNVREDSTVPVAGGYDWMGLCLACSSLKRPTRSHWEILTHLLPGVEHPTCRRSCPLAHCLHQERLLDMQFHAGVAMRLELSM